MSRVFKWRKKKDRGIKILPAIEEEPQQTVDEGPEIHYLGETRSEVLYRVSNDPDSEVPDPPGYENRLYLHDFDLANRVPPPEPPSLVRRLVRSMSSWNLTDMLKDRPDQGDDQDRSVSSASESDLSKRFDNMLSPIHDEASDPAPEIEDVHKATGQTEEPSTAAPDSEEVTDDAPLTIDQYAMETIFGRAFEMGADKLPTNDKEDLDVRLHHHLSELQYLKEHIHGLNETLTQHSHRAMTVRQRDIGGERTYAVMMQHANALRASRDLFKPFYDYHLAELDEIAIIQTQMNIDAGIASNEPDWLKSINDDQELTGMFYV